MYTLGAGRILIKSNIIVCLLNLMERKASWAHRTGENEKKDKIKKSVQTSSACVGDGWWYILDDRINVYILDLNKTFKIYGKLVNAPSLKKIIL